MLCCRSSTVAGDHLYEMDYLKDGIGLRAMAQRDPLVEYQREGFALYSGMMQQIKSESVGFLFNLEVEVKEAPGDPAHPNVDAKGLTPGGQPANLSYTAPSEDGQAEVRDQRGRVEQAATARAQQAQANDQQIVPERTEQAGPAAAPSRGAFGQRVDGAQPPLNRAERRAQDKK